MSADDLQFQPRRVEDLMQEVSAGVLEVRMAVTDVIAKREDLSVLAYDADWHMRGLSFHFARVAESYKEFASGAAGRAQIDSGDGSKADVIIMHAPAYQRMMFDFYAFVNIAKISFDSLRRYLRPAFATDMGQIPKSIMDVLQGSSDCPVYTMLKQREEVRYLTDLRNCIVHYRSLATSDNLIVISQDASQEEVAGLDLGNGWLAPMARAVFRRVDDKSTAVNVYLPDKVFLDIQGGGKRLATFTYESRLNILTFCRDIAFALRQSLLLTFGVHVYLGERKFTWTRI